MPCQHAVVKQRRKKLRLTRLTPLIESAYRPHVKESAETNIGKMEYNFNAPSWLQITVASGEPAQFRLASACVRRKIKFPTY
jgi:hypothetical protein